jgi:hypothetical protein
MIYSPEYNFLMIKNIKVGGTSVEVELSKIFSNNSIVTPIDPPNITHMPRNCDGFYNHMPYSEIKDKIDLSNTSIYTIIRNPYDIILSDFFYRLKLKNIDISSLNKKDIDTYTLDYFLSPMKSTKYLYTENNKILLNDFLFYEKDLEKELNRILSKHNIGNINLNTFEKKYKPKDIKFFDVFSKKQINIINDLWEWEFEYFGYKKV